MIEYLVRNNIDPRVITRAARKLEEGGILAMPTDTTWITACSSNSKDGMKKLRSLSGERDERFFTLLCSKIAQFGNFCNIDNKCFRLINKYTPGPYVFILKTLGRTEKALNLRRSELGVRIPDHPVPRAVIDMLDTPLYTITAKRSMAGAAAEDDETEITDEQMLFESAWEMDDIDGIDVILDAGEELARRVSTILDLTGEETQILRQGAGVFPL